MIIADAGSTKTHWVYVPRSGEPIEWRSPGINALMAPQELLDETARGLREVYGEMHPREVYYYGAGCVGDEAKGRIAAMLREAFGNVSVEVDSDMMGAVRATCGDRPGIVCILGTGSASCLFDGNKIVDQIPSMGYILGDEGSGAALGKRLLRNYFKKELDSELALAFEQEYHLTYEEVVRKVYREPGANRYLASFAPFLKKHIKTPGTSQLVVDEMYEFIDRNIVKYPNYDKTTVHFVGSIAYNFAIEVVTAFEDYYIPHGEIIQSPMEGLIEYHKSKSNNHD